LGKSDSTNARGFVNTGLKITTIYSLRAQHVTNRNWTRCKIELEDWRITFVTPALARLDWQINLLCYSTSGFFSWGALALCSCFPLSSISLLLPSLVNLIIWVPLDATSPTHTWCFTLKWYAVKYDHH